MTAQHRPIVRRPLPEHVNTLAQTLPPLAARVCASRGIRHSDELQHTLDRLPPFELLHGIDTATDLLVQALELQQRILVVGDFDADGATSTALALRVLRLLGAEQVDFLVPNRFEYGYGLTPEIVAVATARRPDLIVTVDNGISSLDGVAAAQALGIKVLITDHHLPGAELPAADAIVNPNQPGDAFPSKAMAGVGVIFYVMLALRSRLRRDGWFARRGIAEPNLAQLLDLVALGTVADVVPLDQVNRILVAQGLARMRRGQLSPGVLALFEVAGRQPARLVAADLGFAIGPRLNAAGRMDDMSLGIRCLLSDDLRQARPLAQTLDQLNQERRGVEEEMKEQALAELRRMHLEESSELPVGLCLYDPAWHQGVVGILASRIKDRLHRPVIVFTDSGDDEIKGSARSVPNLHIRDALDAIAARHPGLLVKFGGHAMAAGLTLRRTALDTFRHAFDDEVRRQLGPQPPAHVLLSDGELAPEEATLEVAETLRFLSPWGQGFPEPLFDGVFDIVSQRVVGERHVKLLLRWAGQSATVDAIAFHADLAQWQGATGQVRLAYRLDVNEFREHKTVQLIVEYMEVVPGAGR
ncbi:single-stranded-DNA-specific exonuclease RecJ [Sulfurivermis fontis]|uniref:single-stranded-DNA-specific exonuclease RecJ n=1 Tax=Sulfurivermis fontis TaxID=1972068 RepID=UPI000FDBB386|nr:single-stranded-DNA-specific exonuclease RecJ [Sulfurivermis fontis]